MPSDVAVSIPRQNEEPTIANVVNDLHSALPLFRIYVCDNNSADSTMSKAKDAAADRISGGLKCPFTGQGRRPAEQIVVKRISEYVFLSTRFSFQL